MFKFKKYQILKIIKNWSVKIEKKTQIWVFKQLKNNFVN